MSSPRQLLRLRGLGLPASALLHLAVLAALINGFRGLPLPPPERPIQVMLVPAARLSRPPPPTPVRQIRLHKPKEVRSSETPPLVTPAAEAPPPAAAPDLNALRIAPFAEPDRAGRALRARARCRGSSLPKTAAEWNDCPPAPLPPKEDEQHYSGIADEKESEFKRAAEVKKEWRDYRDMKGPFPGLRCAFGRKC